MPEPRRNTLRTSQPGKAIWTILTIAVNATRLPLWMLYYIPKATRPHAKWSWGQTVKMRILKAFLTWSSTVEIKTPMDLSPGAEKDQWVLIKPAESRYYTGITVKDSEIKPIQIGGTWYPRVPSANEKSAKIYLHFHGGAYVIGDGRKQDAGFAASTVIKNTDVSYVFCPQYRLASNSGGRFPAPLQDAITSYLYLTQTMGIDASNIIVGGDSAGGNLTLALLHYFTDHGSELDISSPKCAWLWSPWVDPPNSVTDPLAMRQSPHEPTDYLNPAFGGWGAACHAPDPSSGIARDSDYICFVNKAFKTPVPMWISVGGAEVLFHDIIKFYEKFSAVEGNQLEFSVEEYAPHDIILVGKINGFVNEAREAAAKAGKWTSKL